MYNTGDYRILDQPEHATLLERLEYFRALRYSIGAAAATQFATKYRLERLSEWSARIVAGQFSVAEGRFWIFRAMATESEEAKGQYRNYFGKPPATEEWSNLLNVPWNQFSKSDSAQPQIAVLGWGAWAEQHQRQICEMIETASFWLAHKWGVPEKAEEFQNLTTKTFKTLNLFPLIRFYTGKNNDDSKAFYARVRTTSKEHPEWVTFQRWSEAYAGTLDSIPTTVRPRRLPKGLTSLQAQKARQDDPLFNFSSWFYPRLPEGTLFDFKHRKDHSALSLRELETAKTIAPSNKDILWEHLSRSTNYRPTAEQTIAEFNDLSGYDVWAMKTIANSVKEFPDRYERVYNLVCRFEPDHYLDLGDYLVTHGDNQGAAQAYQNAFDYAPDRVAVANKEAWLVDYYFEHGRKDEAFKIAQAGAEVYSMDGLDTMATLLERSGKVEEAERYLLKIKERYSEEGTLGAFYERNKSRSVQYAQAARAAVDKIFPEGLRHIKIDDLKAPPNDGILLSRTGRLAERAGLRVGDVLVAIDGVQIQNKDQYYFARALSYDSNITYLLFRAGRYLELKANLPQRRNYSAIESYSVNQPRNGSIP
jgi:hypothetical protein